MSHRLRVQRRDAASAPPVLDESRVEAPETQTTTPPAPAPALAHDFATLDIASQDQLTSLAGPEVQRSHLRIQPREPRFQWGTGLSVQRSTQDLGQRIRAAQAGGSPLEPGVQQQLESGLGADLSGVRVHTDGEADQLSQEVSATAFTTGSHIFLRSGTYSPHSDDGMHLLAHEAAHTVQQAQGPVSGTPGPGGVSISDPSDSFEQAAETAAQRVISGDAASRDVEVPASGQPTTGSLQLQRIPEWLKFWKKSPPPPPRAPAGEILPLPQEARAQDIESEQGTPAAPAPAAEDAQSGYDAYVPASDSAPAHEYDTLPEQPGARALAAEHVAPPEEPYHEYDTLPEQPGARALAAEHVAPPEEPYHEYDTLSGLLGARALAAEHVAPPPVATSAPGSGYAPQPQAENLAAGYSVRVVAASSLPPREPAAVVPRSQPASFAEELADRAQVRRGRYANLRHREDLRQRRQPATLPPGEAEQAKYKTRELVPLFQGEQERTAKEKWVGGKYVGQTGYLLQHTGLAVKYLTEDQRAEYEVRLNKDDKSFYWEQTGQVFNTEKMSSVAGYSKEKGRALFVMTAGGKIYAANEGYETRRGASGPQGERWRFNHSSFLAGEPVAAAGQLIFDKGKLVGITDISGHYHPQVGEMRQVIQEFVAQGVDVSGVWVLLSEKVGKEGEWYVQAQDLIKYPQHNEAQFRSEKIGSPTI